MNEKKKIILLVSFIDLNMPEHLKMKLPYKSTDKYLKYLARGQFSGSRLPIYFDFAVNNLHSEVDWLSNQTL